MPAVNNVPTPMNTANFLKMAHGDLALLEAGNFKLRHDLHRRKGSASLFGLERIVALIGSCESTSVLEQRGFDLISFETELAEPERAVMAMTD